MLLFLLNLSTECKEYQTPSNCSVSQWGNCPYELMIINILVISTFALGMHLSMLSCSGYGGGGEAKAGHLTLTEVFCCDQNAPPLPPASRAPLHQEVEHFQQVVALQA